MAILNRNFHTIDESHGSFNTRKIGKWLNYTTPSGIMSPIDTEVEVATGAPPDWNGNFEFEHYVLRQPLQIFVGDSTDPANTALWGMRIAASPNKWVNYKAINVNQVPKTVDVANKSVTWVELWDNTDLTLEVGRHRFDRKITLKGAGHPVSFRFAIRHPSDCSFSLVDDQIKFFHDIDGQYMHTIPGNGKDANGNIIRVNIVAAPDITVGQRTFPTFRVVPNATDLATAVYPIIL